MKKSYILLAIVGWFLIAINTLGAANLTTRLTNLPQVNVAFFIDALLHVAMGALFIWTYYKLKKASGQEGLLPASEHERLDIFRRWVLSFVILYAIAGSVSVWVLNDYTVGLTLINISVIFDLFVNVLLLVIVIGLLYGRNWLNQLLWAMVAYGLVSAALLVARDHWYGALMYIVYVGYFVYAIKAPLTQRHFRIAHFVIFPIAIIITFASTYFDNGNIPSLVKQSSLLQQQYTNDSNELSYHFANFSKTPNSIDLQNMQQSLDKRNERLQKLIDNGLGLKAEYLKQLPNISQQETIEEIRLTLRAYAVHQEQSQKLGELIKYAKKLDLTNLTSQQMIELNTLGQVINSYSEKITEALFEIDSANLNMSQI